jgi:hypothetical protein
MWQDLRLYGRNSMHASPMSGAEYGSRCDVERNGQVKSAMRHEEEAASVQVTQCARISN